MDKKYYAIFHGVDEDGGFGDAVYTEIMVGIVEATQEEIDAFVQKWDKPIVYEKPYDNLTCHNVRAEEVKVCGLGDLKPYGEPDYYGLRAKEYEFRKAFEAEHGDSWNRSEDRDKLYELFFEGIKAIRNERGGESDEQV